MKNNRRDFLKLGALASLSFVSPKLSASSPEKFSTMSPLRKDKRFNMSGYAAPKLETVRIGIIGLGMRGPGAVKRLSLIEGVEIKALCDLKEENTSKAKSLLEGTKHDPVLYHGDDQIWKELVERDDLDLIYITTPWDWHTPMALHAMESGKHAAVEVPAAQSLEDCWKLVETSERTKKHCMMLENCCYDFFELLTLNMARQGFFGEIVHTEGAYIHNLVDLNFDKNGYQGMWRLEENIGRNGNLYPTHGLGPLCQIMNINRGDQFDYLTSVSTDDFNMGPRAEELGKTDDFYKPYQGRDYRGNMNTTTIKTKNGKSIMIQHDISSPRPYSRIHLVSGSKAFARKWPSPRIAKGHSWISQEEMEELRAQYTPEIVRKVGDLAKQVGGHGGMDFIMDWRLIDCLRNGLPLDQDVYDAAAWSAVGILSEESVSNRSKSVDVPDFTGGNWKKNKPVDLSLSKSGDTKVLM